MDLSNFSIKKGIIFISVFFASWTAWKTIKPIRWSIKAFIFLIVCSIALNIIGCGVSIAMKTLWRNNIYELYKSNIEPDEPLAISTHDTKTCYYSLRQIEKDKQSLKIKELKFEKERQNTEEEFEKEYQNLSRYQKKIKENSRSVERLFEELKQERLVIKQEQELIEQEQESIKQDKMEIAVTLKYIAPMLDEKIKEDAKIKYENNQLLALSFLKKGWTQYPELQPVQKFMNKCSPIYRPNESRCDNMITTCLNFETKNKEMKNTIKGIVVLLGKQKQIAISLQKEIDNNYNICKRTPVSKPIKRYIVTPHNATQRKFSPTSNDLLIRNNYRINASGMSRPKR